MATIITEITKNATDVAAKAKIKTNELTTYAKINLKIKARETKLMTIYEELGRLFYATDKTGADNANEIANCILKADKYNQEIDALKKQLTKLRNMKNCCECGNEINLNFAYCNYCGAKQPALVEESVAIEPVAVVIEEPVAIEPVVIETENTAE